MSLSPLALASILGVPLVLGAACLRLLGVTRRTDPLAYFGWAWLLGTLALGVVLSGWLWLGAPLAARALVPALLLLAGIAWGVGRRVAEFRPEPGACDESRAERALFTAVLVFVLVATAARIQLAPNELVLDGDEAHIWAARAKALYVAGGFGQEYRAFLAAGRVFDHPDYPPLNPLLQTWVFAHAGAILHAENRLPVECMGLAYVLVAAGAVRRRLRAAVAALFLAALASIGLLYFSVTTAFSDLMVAGALFACFDLWQRHEEDGGHAWLALLGCLAPFLLWSKNEGWMLVLAGAGSIVLAGLVRRARVPRGILPWLVPLALSGLYLLWFNRHFALTSDVLRGQGEQGLLTTIVRGGPRRLGQILEHLARRALLPSTQLLLPAFLLVLVLAPARAFARGRAAFTLTLLAALAGYVVVYLGTHWELQRHLESSAHRVLFQLTPAAGLWLALHVADVLPEYCARQRSG